MSANDPNSDVGCPFRAQIPVATIWSLGAKDDMAADIARPGTGDRPAALGAEAAEHDRQLRELLEFSPAAIGIVDEAGRLQLVLRRQQS